MRLIALLIFLIPASTGTAQPAHFTDTVINAQHFHYVEQMPEAGYDFDKYFREHFQRSSGAEVPDTVVVSFVVMNDGTLSGYKVVKGTQAERDIIATMQMMPKWKPGRQNRKAVPVEMVCRIMMKKE